MVQLLILEDSACQGMLGQLSCSSGDDALQIEYISRLDGINELAAATLQDGLRRPPRIK